MTGTVLIDDRAERWRLGRSYQRAFRELGWKACMTGAEARDHHLAFWLRSPVGRRVTRRMLALRRRGARAWNRRLLELCGRVEPDLLILLNGSMVMPETVRALRDRGVAVPVIYADDPTPGSGNHRPEYVQVAREADACFIWSRYLAQRLTEAGARNVRCLPFAWDPAVFPYDEPSESPRYEIVFIGGWDRGRESWLEPVAREYDLKIWGPDYWRTRTRPGSPLQGCWQGGAVRGAEAARVVRQAAIVLNVLRRQNLPDGTNMRTFEVPGAGGFQLATRTAGATEIYPEGQAGAYFGSVDEMLVRIGHFLRDAAGRRAIARRAHAITAREHRYVHRVHRVLRMLGWKP